MTDMFWQTGFREVVFQSNLEALPDYLADFIPRLRTAKSSLFSDIEEKYLVPIGGRFVIRK
jgi:hypothetical protein